VIHSGYETKAVFVLEAVQMVVVEIKSIQNLTGEIGQRQRRRDSDAPPRFAERDFERMFPLSVGWEYGITY
jgi:hypothetical protein